MPASRVPLFPQVPYGRPGLIALAQARQGGSGPGPPGSPLALPQGMPCLQPAARTRQRDSHSSLSDRGIVRNPLQLCSFLGPFSEDRKNGVIDVYIKDTNIYMYSFSSTFIQRKETRREVLIYKVPKLLERSFTLG